MIITIDISQVVYGTGVSRYTAELVRNVLRIDKRNQYKLFAGVWKQREGIDRFLAELQQEGLAYNPYVKLFPPKLADRVWNQWHLWPIEQFVGKTDLVHTSNWAQPPSKARKITTVHDLTPLVFPDHHVPTIVHNFKKNLYWIEKECDQVICDSQATKQDLQRLTPIDHNKIEVVYLAAAAKFKRIESRNEIEKVKRIYGIKNRYILSVGTQEPRKNIKRVVEAYNQLGLKDCQLVMAGKKGWLSASPVSSPQSLIITTGFVDDADLPALYSGAEMFVYPSLYEGFGLPVLEAMQCGCPVITSNRSSLPEVVGDAGLSVDPENTMELALAMKQILENKKLQEELSMKSLKQASQFSWEKTAEQTLAVYEDIFLNN